MSEDDEKPRNKWAGFWPPAPPGGGVLVLSAAQLGCLDLLCGIKTVYPNTKIIPQQQIPTK